MDYNLIAVLEILVLVALFWFIILISFGAIVNGVRGATILKMPYRKLAIGAIILTGLGGSLVRQDPDPISSAPTELSQEDRSIIQAAKQSAYLVGGVTKELHESLWAIFDEDLTDTEVQQLFDMFCSQEQSRMALLFWEDVIATIQTGVPVVSAERKLLEQKFSQFPFVSRNKEKLERIANGEPIEVSGEIRIVTIDDAQIVLNELISGLTVFDNNCEILRDRKAFD